jgi:hypothetical protein
MQNIQFFVKKEGKKKKKIKDQKVERDYNLHPLNSLSSVLQTSVLTKEDKGT